MFARLNSDSFDIAIVGAGPAGTATALALEGSGLSIALIDKDGFPRDKICGDALSPDVVSQLNKLPLDSGPLFSSMEEKIWCRAVRFVAPNFKHVDLQLTKDNITGYVSKRLDFDHFMFEQAIKNKNVKVFSGSKVKDVRIESSHAEVILANEQVIKAQIVLGADGANSVVKRKLQGEEIDRNHHCAGLRVYYENVSGFSEDNAVELHFYKDLLPGYFWVFPLPNNQANVGLGMHSAHIAKRKPNLKKMLAEIIEAHPNVAPRFKNAKPTETVKGFGLPLGSKKRKISGNRFLLLGDAASLINPLSGEGIGNAIRSGRVAAEYLVEAFKVNKFDAPSNKAYDKDIYHRMWKELQLNYWLQRTMRNPTLCNFVVERAIASPSVQKMVLSGFDVDNIKSQLRKPSFYLDLLRNKGRNQESQAQ